MPNCMPNRLNRPPKRLNREHHQDEMHEEGEKEKFEMPPMRRCLACSAWTASGRCRACGRRAPAAAAGGFEGASVVFSLKRVTICLRYKKR
jgi:hypothetical protein